MHRFPLRSDRRAARPSRSPHLVSVIALAVLSLAACGGPPAETSADAAGGGAPSAAAGVASAADASACPMEGDWTPCAVEERLKRAGVVIERHDEPVRHPFLTVPGVSYHVGNAEHELQVFLYPTAAARSADTDALDSAAVSPRGTRVAWRTPPTLVVSNNLAAIILTLNDRTAERLTLALGAGLPLPEKR